MKYNGIVLSDVHVGSFDVEKLYTEFENVFINYIIEFENSNNLDFLIITGDFFDSKFYLNDKKSLYAYKMLKRICDVCPNSKIRIVYGTESHECNQYDIMNIINLHDDIKVIKTVESEEIFDGLNFLYLPEEVMLDKKEYYNNYFIENEYNYVFGHGIIQEVMTNVVKHMNISKEKRERVPVFTTKELENICKGEVYFGHYHLNREIDDKIISVGSFSRWQFWEDERKGFHHISYDTDKEKYNREFIENTLAETYVTINFGYNSEVFKSEDNLQRELDKCDNFIKTDAIDHIRFQLNIPIDNDHPEAIMNYVKERYKYNKSVKVNVVNGYIEEKKEQAKKEISEENKKYSFIYDETPMENKISYYIVIEKDKNIDPDTIYIYLNCSVEEIISKIEAD